MTDLPAVFAELHDLQPRATELLAAAVAGGRVSHAYLFLGTPGALITETAHAFAAALTCEDGGCGACEACRRVERGSHPDVTELVPEGARAYLVEQIREVVTAAQYAPTMGRRRIFIFNRADLMNQASANAFLKTLEEPPANVCFILMAPTETSVLPTVLSRCQVVRFRAIPAAEGTALVSERAHVSPDRAELALAA
ncbi:MAG: DNA polymerase III subunit delta, partial [Eggerthellaceae bacterium]|nr:DNA polymerase III subunit delta [Eggerthellaceae bacterium]